ncbi:glycoprotein E [Psittacid alphaherpesvirus 1]|uniref:Envelope glycoprotein E n=1 Tax=Psittacid herpesvirus 1 (isolate Amazon parrot/-/97-0001/1997) TaxID=670426 RepID=GE_PSHV1|nr:envelope glycoprotein E [Psittacid alphaherpesvirus 1]Q6UDF4.1 RecName: Full=Envelope glycoprotein E; Short=gE; Flags: Precursor [Psittacid herpesvirus 1 Amazon parrot/1997]AAQ73756.1 glycoprotein E [Psittacid alphaherpesvirus 1]
MMPATLAGLALAVTVATMFAQRVDSTTIHHVSGLKGKPLLFGPSLRRTLPAGGTFKWVLVLSDPCAPKPTEICVSVGHCFYDLVSSDNDSECANKDRRVLTLALLTKSKTGELRVIGPMAASSALVGDAGELEQLRRRVSAGMGLTDDGDISFAAADKVNEGLYGVRVMGSGDSYTFFNVTVATETAGDDRDLATVRHVDIAHNIVPSEDRDHVFVSMPRMHVAWPHGTTVLHPKMIIAAASWRPEYNFTYEWYAVPYDGYCATMRLFEACLYHPSAPACLDPAGHRGCVVGTMTHDDLVGRVLMARCRGSDLRTCEPHVIHIKQKPMVSLGRAVPELRVESAAHIPSLYILVVKIDDSVAGWAYTELMAEGSSPRVVIDIHMPRPTSAQGGIAALREIENDDSAPSLGSNEGGGPGNSKRRAAVLGAAVWIALTLLILGGLGAYVAVNKKCLRDKRQWLRGSRKPTLETHAHTYTSLPVGGDLSLEQDAEDEDEDEEELLYERERRRSSSGSKKSSRSPSRRSSRRNSFGPTLSANALSRFDKTVKLAMAEVAGRLLANKTFPSQRY